MAVGLGHSAQRASYLCVRDVILFETRPASTPYPAEFFPCTLFAPTFSDSSVSITQLFDGLPLYLSQRSHDQTPATHFGSQGRRLIFMVGVKLPLSVSPRLIFFVITVISARKRCGSLPGAYVDT